MVTGDNVQGGGPLRDSSMVPPGPMPLAGVNEKWQTDHTLSGPTSPCFPQLNIRYALPICYPPAILIHHLPQHHCPFMLLQKWKWLDCDTFSLYLHFICQIICLFSFLLFYVFFLMNIPNFKLSSVSIAYRWLTWTLISVLSPCQNTWTPVDKNILSFLNRRLYESNICRKKGRTNASWNMEENNSNQGCVSG